MNKFKEKIKEELREPHIPLAIVAGLSILIMAYFSKKLLSRPIDYLPLAIPPFLMTIYEAIYKKQKEHWITKQWIWILAIILSTAIVLYCYR